MKISIFYRPSAIGHRPSAIGHRPSAMLSILMLSVMLAFNSRTIAQGFFNEVNPTGFTFSSTEQTIWNAELARPENELTKLIQFGNLNNSVGENGEIALDIPGDGLGLLLFDPQFVEYVSETDYTWHGTVHDATSPGSADGYFLLISSDGTRFGEINIDSSVYAIKSLNSTHSILVKYRDSWLERGVCNNNAAPVIEDPEPPLEAPCTGAPCNVVRLAFIATGSVEGIPATIAKTGIALLNAALSNSAISQNTLKFENAGVMTMSSLVESNSIDNDLTTFMANTTALAFKTANKADMLVFLTDGNYCNSGGCFLGLTPSINVTGGPIATAAFSIVEADEAISHKTLCHEIGHEMGGDHSCATTNLIPCTGTPPAIQHGFVFNIPKERHTIMTSPTFIKKKVLHYSNPAVNFPGTTVATGNSSANVAAFLASVACTVSNHVPNSNFTAQITTPHPNNTIVYGSGPVQATAVLNCGVTPFNRQWAWSTKATGYQPIGGNTANISIPVPTTCEGGCKIYIRLVATDATGAQLTVYAQVTVVEGFQGGGGSSLVKNTSNSGVLFPNPATGAVNIDFAPVDWKTPVEINLMNVLGKICLQTRFIYEGNPTSISLDVLPSEMYFVNCAAGEKKATFTLSILEK